MLTPLQIRFHQIPHSDAVEQFVRDKVAKLERHYDRIVGCNVTIERPPHHHNKGNPFHVRVELSVPKETILVTRDPGDRHNHEDVYLVLRDAFNAASRQLETYVATHVHPRREGPQEVA